jgi:hypothetical protein
MSARVPVDGNAGPGQSDPRNMWTTSARALLYHLLRRKQTSMLPSPTRRPLALFALLLPTGLRP